MQSFARKFDGHVSVREGGHVAYARHRHRVEMVKLDFV